VWDRELTGAEEKECAEIIGHIHFQMNHAAHLIECALPVCSDVPRLARRFCGCRAENAAAYGDLSPQQRHRRAIILLVLQVRRHASNHALSPMFSEACFTAEPFADIGGHDQPVCYPATRHVPRCKCCHSAALAPTRCAPSVVLLPPAIAAITSHFGAAAVAFVKHPPRLVALALAIAPTHPPCPPARNRQLRTHCSSPKMRAGLSALSGVKLCWT
jgi:hypothetical protein